MHVCTYTCTFLMCVCACVALYLADYPAMLACTCFPSVGLLIL